MQFSQMNEMCKYFLHLPAHLQYLEIALHADRGNFCLKSALEDPLLQLSPIAKASLWHAEMIVCPSVAIFFLMKNKLTLKLTLFLWRTRRAFVTAASILGQGG